MSEKKPQGKKANEVETTGHSWDGIEEYNNPLPRWWLWTFYACIIWALIYSVLYPAWPLVKGATPGLLGWSTRGDVAKEIQQFDDKNAAINAKLVATDLNDVAKDPALQQYAVNAGGAVFRTWCAQCHGAGAGGNKGFPNLLDDDWLHGGTLDQIYTTVQHGVRDPADENTLPAPAMPAWADVLEPKEITDVVQYVLKISGQKADAAAADAGATVFADNCASCHGEDAKGMVEMGAPNLTDAIWLYGGDVKTITETVDKGRAGVMPSWTARLKDADIRAVAVYVHGLGGGE
ncbi:cytochrome-c oxidase, cbb3-type subunit III [Acidimangrovimonas pyrenivorans]|uniref:Cbb3-type cytochrome c oxidase subunit n=1 Tax=Acidimangrovimonas pyrenivorans TaxID=2030798 RepID=A0ABV7AGY4_9RHOB